MEEPDKINPNRLGDYLEIMTKAVFQSGISWKVVSSKWPGIVEAFQGFDAETVAGVADYSFKLSPVANHAGVTG